MDELVNQLITTIIGIAICAFAYLIDLVVGARKVAKEQRKWSWAIAWRGILDGLTVAFTTVALVALMYALNWFGGMVGADLSFLTDTISYALIIGAIILGTATYAGRAGKNVIAFWTGGKAPIKVDEQKLEEATKAIGETTKEIVKDIVEDWAPAIQGFISKGDKKVTQKQIDAAISKLDEQMGGSGDALALLQTKQGQYLREDGSSGEYRGQCTQVPAEFRALLGITTASMGNGKDVVQNLINTGLAVECGPEPGAAFSDTRGKYGHTGVMADADILIEQNVAIKGLPSQNFGEGATYPVRIGRLSEAWRNAGSGYRFCRLKAFNSNPTPQPSPQPSTPASRPSDDGWNPLNQIKEITVNQLWIRTSPEAKADLSNIATNDAGEKIWYAAGMQVRVNAWKDENGWRWNRYTRGNGQQAYIAEGPAGTQNQYMRIA